MREACIEASADLGRPIAAGRAPRRRAETAELGTRTREATAAGDDGGTRVSPFGLIGRVLKDITPFLEDVFTPLTIAVRVSRPLDGSGSNHGSPPATALSVSWSWRGDVRGA